jgi:hypothetical protein
MIITLTPRTIQVVDLADFRQCIDHELYVNLLSFINESEVSWGNNDDTLITAKRCAEFLEAVLEEYLDGTDEAWRVEHLSQLDELRALLRAVEKLPDTTFIALGA